MKANTKISVSFQTVNKTANSSKSVPKKESIQVSNSKENVALPSVVEENKSQAAPSKSLYSNGRQEKKKKEKSIEEEIMEREISSLEKTRLHRAFEILCGKEIPKTENEYAMKDKMNSEDDKMKDLELEKREREEFFTSKDVMRVLEKLNYKLSKQEVDLMIWEVDEDLDEHVNRYEFNLMYKRCIYDKTGLEPKQLFYLVEFLMYDKQERNKITIEDTLELLYVKTKNYNKSTWEDEIHSIFGTENKNNEDGKETEITYKQFLESQIKKSIETLRKKETEKKLQKPLTKKNEEEML